MLDLPLQRKPAVAIGVVRQSRRTSSTWRRIREAIPGIQETLPSREARNRVGRVVFVTH